MLFEGTFSYHLTPWIAVCRQRRLYWTPLNSFRKSFAHLCRARICALAASWLLVFFPNIVKKKSSLPFLVLLHTLKKVSDQNACAFKAFSWTTVDGVWPSLSNNFIAENPEYTWSTYFPLSLCVAKVIQPNFSSSLFQQHALQVSIASLFLGCQKHTALITMSSFHARIMLS